MNKFAGAPRSAELQGRTQNDELGVLGLEAYSGYIRMAYNAELYWPACYPLYDRIRRSDPEISMTRIIWGAYGREMRFRWELSGENSSDEDKKVVDFCNEVLDDIDGGMDTFRDTLLAYVPFMGFGVWEIVPGIRQKAWRPPNERDTWRSQYDDGSMGIRRLAFRDHSSFESWDMDDKTGVVYGFNQVDTYRGLVTIPFDRALHITFGDAHNPEGLAPLEAVWRLERIKYGLEVIQGIGFEHAAGHAKFNVNDKITADDRALIRKAARAIMSAQEGNYVVLPEGIDADVMDIPFAAAEALLAAIRYYGLLKLQIFNMQWVAMATTSGAGAYSAVQDASGMFLKSFNSMMDGFTDQTGEQLWRWIKTNNDLQVTRKPKLVATPIEKVIPLDELGQFMAAFANIFPMSDKDIISIRRKSGFLSETLPEPDETIRPDKPDQPTDHEELAQLVAEFEGWAQVNRPEVYEFLCQ